MTSNDPPSNTVVGATTKTTATNTTTTTTTNPKGTAKRDALRHNEQMMQRMWDECQAFEVNPSSSDTTSVSSQKQETFMVTFPYPYANGHLHIGHAYSLTKAIFRAQYERHLQKHVLFPFAFHCTGMPIQAVRSIRPQREWEKDSLFLISKSIDSPLPCDF
jgi:isoleucyl-tRNA synthetase